VSPLLLILVLYSLALIALGAWISRRVRAAGDFFVGGRSLGTGLIFATFLAPNIGAGSTVGATDLAYREGLAAWWWNGGAGLGSLVLAFWVGPKIWREGVRLKLLTVGDFLEHHYGRGVRGLAVTLIWIGTLAVLCAQLDGIAAVLAAAGHLSHAAGCLVGAIVITAYFAAGGFASAARVNAVQLAVKIAGFAVAVPLAIAVAGGWQTIQAANVTRLDFWSRTATGEGWPLLFLTGPAFFLSPGLLQKAFGARDERTLRRGVALNAIGLLLFGFVPVTLGLAARAAFPVLPPDGALPSILASIPLAAGGLALAAVFSAELSAADAVLFMLSTSGARDLYKTFIRPDATDQQVLRVARLAAIVGGVVAYGLTFVFATVLGALKLFYAILVVALFVPILGGLYFPQGGSRAAVAAIVTGVAALAGSASLTHGAGIGWVSPTLIALCASGLAFVIAGLSARATTGRSD